MNAFDMRCPKCRGTDEIDIEATVTVRLTFDGTEEDGGHAWDDKSPASCATCGHEGVVSEFEPEEE
jgi:hypothetical protein